VPSFSSSGIVGAPMPMTVPSLGETLKIVFTASYVQHRRRRVHKDVQSLYLGHLTPNSCLLLPHQGA
jgi:hypothetical protein